MVLLLVIVMGLALGGMTLWIIDLRNTIQSQKMWLRMLDRRFDEVADQVVSLRRRVDIGDPGPTEAELQEAEEALIRLLDQLIRVEGGMKPNGDLSPCD